MKDKEYKYELYMSLMLLLFSITVRILIPFQVQKMSIAGKLTTKTIPMATTYLLIILSIIYVIRQVIMRKGKREESITDWVKKNKELIVKMFISILFIFVYILLLIYFNYIFATILFAICFSLYLGNRKWYLLLITCVVVPLLIYYVFHILLYVPLP